MIKVIGVRFRRAGKVYYFNPLDMDITTGMHVIVETARGVEYGYVVLGVKDMDEEKVFQPLKPVIRIATPQDDAVADENRQKEKDAFKICKEKIAKHGLDMKLIDAEYTFDNNKVLFYFTADGRVDFRELVKDLASVFRTRIELRQIGVRDEAKIIRGVGPCGQPCCCSYWLNQFAPICIKMVKEQNLALNPAKISGICGRLMCCMCFEHNVYHEMWEGLPNPGTKIKTPNGNVIVAGIEIHSKNVRCFVPGRGEVRVPIKDFELFKDTVIAGGDWIVEEENKDAPLGDIRGIFPDFSSRSDALVPLSERAEIEVIPDKKNVAQEHNEYPVHDKSAKKKKRRPRKPNNGVEQQNVREHEGQEKEHKTVQEDPSAQGTQPKPHRPRHRRPRGQKKTAETKPK